MAEPRRARIEELRVTVLHMSRQELAAEAGISYKHMWGIERGKHPVKVETLYKIADALGVDITEVMASTSNRRAAEPSPQPRPDDPRERRTPTTRPEPTSPVPPPGRTRGPRRSMDVGREKAAS